MRTLTIAATDPRPAKVHRLSAHATHPLAAAARFVAAALHAYRIWRATRALMRLNDALLRDIGLSRGAIDYTVRSGRERA
jgi:uncharacterized protein YjiS (DUF1127 family)